MKIRSGPENDLKAKELLVENKKLELLLGLKEIESVNRERNMKKILMETLIIGSVLGSKPVVQKPKSIENSQNESLR